MARRTLWVVVAVAAVTALPLRLQAASTTTLFMPDGQLTSHAVRVYVTQDIVANQQPRLRLLRSHAVTKKAADEATRLEPGVVAPGQEWLERVNGQEVRRAGTLLMFDLSGMTSSYKAMVRVMPVLTWTD